LEFAVRLAAINK